MRIFLMIIKWRRFKICKLRSVARNMDVSCWNINWGQTTACMHLYHPKKMLDFGSMTTLSISWQKCNRWKRCYKWGFKSNLLGPKTLLIDFDRVYLVWFRSYTNGLIMFVNLYFWVVHSHYCRYLSGLMKLILLFETFFW